MSRKLIFLLFLLASCSAQEKVDPEPVVAQQEEKQVIGGVTQTLNVSYQNLFPLIQKVLAARNIGVKRIDSALGKLVTEAVHVEDKKGSIPLNCDVTFTFLGKPYKDFASKIELSYLEQCDGLESLDIKQAESKAEKLMVSIIDDIKSACK